MFIYRSRFLTRGEVWFDDKPDGTPVDWIYHRQRSDPVFHARWKYTVLIDLAKRPAQLLAEMDEKTAQKIEAAEKTDRTRWELCQAGDPKILDAVEQSWNDSAAARKSAPLDRAWLEKLIEAGALEISVTRDAAGQVLTHHVAYAGKKRAQFLIVISRHGPVPNPALRNRIRCASCLGHWKMMLLLQERGLRHFDFGGWYPGSTDIQLLGLNAFKTGFGGQIVREFDCEEIRTIKGWIVLTAARLQEQARTWTQTRNGPAGNPAKRGSLAHANVQDGQVSAAFR